MENKLIGLCKGLWRIAKTIVGISGIMLVVFLAIWSAVYLKGGSTEKAVLDLSKLVQSQELAYIWIGSFITIVIGSVVWLFGEIKKGVVKAKDPKLSAEEKGRSLFWWLIKHI